MYVEPFVQARGWSSSARRRSPTALARLARSMDYDVVRVVDRRSEQRDIEQEAAALGVTVVTLDALETMLARQRRRRRRSGGRRRVAGALRRGGARSDPAMRRAVRRPRGVAHARGRRPRAARGTRRAGRRDDPESGGPRSGRADAAGSRAVDPRRDRPGASRAARAWRQPRRRTPPPAAAPPAPATAVDPVCGMSVAVATARHTAEVDGVTYYFCCAGCRAQVPRRPSRIPGAFMTDAAAIHDRFRERASSSTRRSRPRCRSCSRSRSRCSSRDRPASARPRARRCSPRCSARS